MVWGNEAAWLVDIDYDQFKSLGELREFFANYVRDKNNQPHSSLPNKISLIDRLNSEPDMIQQVYQKRLDIAFLHREERCVANDGTIKLHGRQFETGQTTIGERVTFRYQLDLSAIYTEWNEQLMPIQR